MERRSVHQKIPKQANAKKKPIKVVYISNPMKFKTSAAEFRALVQKLTGRDSDIADNVSKYPMVEATDEDDDDAVRREEQYKSPASPFEMFDEGFGPQMLENFPGFMHPSLFCEAHSGGVFRNLDEP